MVELSCDVPVLKSCNLGGVKGFVTFSVCSMTGSTGGVSIFSCNQISLHRRFWSLRLEGCQISSDVSNILILFEGNGDGTHLHSGNIVYMNSSNTIAVIDQLPLNIPVLLT